MKASSLLIAFAAFNFTGCIMPESNHVEPDFYLLSDVPHDNNASTSPPEFSFYLREIELPRYLKDPRMVFRPTPHTIEFRESKRWGEPLEDGIARVISLNFQNQVPSSQFSIFPNRRKDALKWDLSISFSSFEVINDVIVIDSKWSAKDKSGLFVSGSYSANLPLDRKGGALGEVKGFNHALYDLTKQILEKIPPS